MPDQTSERKSEDYIKLGRSLIQNHLETEKRKIPDTTTTLNKISDFITKRIWTWLYYYIDSRFGANHPYPDYADTTDKGIYRLSKSASSTQEYISIALCADWATNTRESVQVAKGIQQQNPDYTIHLGDTYFVGEPKEMKRNFIDPGSPWVRGAVGSFAILGNHEMYARGIAFFDHLLPSLGLKVGGVYQGQQAGFVCLENDHWRILALDTGYHSIGRVPIMEMLPWFAPDSRLDPKLMKWLKEEVKLDDANDKRGLVILSHHQYITAFNEGEFPKPAQQLASLIGTERPVLWIWGHEHKFSIYEKARVGEGITAYGRCIGHGGMPVELKAMKLKKGKRGTDKLVVYDHRIHRTRISKKLPLGFNGFAVLKIKEEELTIEYRDFFRLLVVEQWLTKQDGTIMGRIIPTPACPLEPEAGKHWDDAVR